MKMGTEGIQPFPMPAQGSFTGNISPLCIFTYILIFQVYCRIIGWLKLEATLEIM